MHVLYSYYIVNIDTTVDVVKRFNLKSYRFIVFFLLSILYCNIFFYTHVKFSMLTLLNMFFSIYNKFIYMFYTHIILLILTQL